MTEIFQLAEETATLSAAIENAREALLTAQRDDGHWCFELEADCTIPAEYIMMMHYMDEIDSVLERKIAVYLREKQNEAGGWPLYYGGKTDLSCTVKVYYALKMTGDSPEAPHMQRARACILRLAARRKPMSLLVLPWRCLARFPGGRCHLFPLK